MMMQGKVKEAWLAEGCRRLLSYMLLTLGTVERQDADGGNLYAYEQIGGVFQKILLGRRQLCGGVSNRRRTTA